MPGSGTKVTTDPESQQKPIVEKPGPITSDSLAAESDRTGGEFSKNVSSTPQGVSSKSATFATEDTSAAVTLPPTSDRPSRSAEYGGSSEPRGHTGPKYPDSVGGQTGGASVGDGGSSGGATYSTGTGSSGQQVDTAPSYVKGSITQFPGEGKPKSSSLTEGGFDADAPNASFGTDIGSKNDPGRLAEKSFGAKAAYQPGAAGMVPQSAKSDKGPYGALERDESS